MLRKIIFFAVHQPLFIFLLLVLFIGVGIFAFQTLPIEAFPDVTDIQVTVVTLYPGHAAEEVEKQVTIPLEIALGRPAALRCASSPIRSTDYRRHTSHSMTKPTITSPGSKCSNAFDPWNCRRVFSLNSLLYPVPIGEIYRVYLKSDTYDAMELADPAGLGRRAQSENGSRRRGRCQRGGFIKQYQVVPDLTRLKSHGITLAAGIRCAGPRQYERRRRLYRARRAAVHHPRSRSAAIARGHPQRCGRGA